MEERNVCDYSLLVGIHTTHQDVSTHTFKTLEKTDMTMSQWHNRSISIWNRDHGGIRAKTPSKEVYFLGIVDILTQYDFKKRSEHMLKSLVYYSDEISAIPPTPYRERFVKYIASITE